MASCFQFQFAPHPTDIGLSDRIVSVFHKFLSVSCVEIVLHQHQFISAVSGGFLRGLRGINPQKKLVMRSSNSNLLKSMVTETYLQKNIQFYKKLRNYTLQSYKTCALFDTKVAG